MTKRIQSKLFCAECGTNEIVLSLKESNDGGTPDFVAECQVCGAVIDVNAVIDEVLA